VVEADLVGGPLGERLRTLPGDVLAVVLRRGGEPERDPAFRRALAIGLNPINTLREVPLRPIDARGAYGVPQLVVDVLEQDGRMRFDAALVMPGNAVSPERFVSRPWRLPGARALTPAVVAIGVALLFGRVVVALLAGVAAGAIVLRAEAGTGWLASLPYGLWDVVGIYLLRELADSFRYELLGVVVALLALVRIAGRSGGVHGLVERLRQRVRDVRTALWATYGTGLLIAFDDYTSCMLVGKTLRPLCDGLRVSREKLAYLVDSTAAPVAGLSLVSTWVAFQVSVFAPQLPGVGIEDAGYSVLLQALPFRFYCLFTLLLAALTIWSGRDFGPMLAAERRARATGELVRPGGLAVVPSEPVESLLEPRASRLLAPLLVVLVLTFLESFRRGGGFGLLVYQPGLLFSLDGIGGVLAQGGSGAPLFVGSLGGLLTAVALAGSNALRVALATGLVTATLADAWLAPRLAGLLLAGTADYAAALIGFAAGAGTVGWLAAPRLPSAHAHLPAGEIGRAALASSNGLAIAVGLLFGAWMLSRVSQDIGTADYLVALFAGDVSPLVLPAALFALACSVSFALGTSWGAMSLLVPQVVGLAAAAGGDSIGSAPMVVLCIAAVLEGSVFGDHCSPIADTTVLASLSSASDHGDHVRTQLPYALLAAGAAVLFGYLPCALLGYWALPIALAGGAAALIGVLWFLGEPVPRPESTRVGDEMGARAIVSEPGVV